MELSVHILGGVRVTSEGSEVPITSRRQRALLAALALRPGHPVSDGQLVDALWGEEPPDQAPTTLQTYVSRLRRTLGTATIVRDHGGYRLGDGITSDAATARRLTEEARESPTPDRIVELALEALDLWRGPALSEFASEPWFAPDATGLEELRANLTDMAGRALVAAGRSEEAIELLEPVTRASPLREPTHVLLVEALTQSGRSVEAVRAADRYRRSLREETGLEPGADLATAERRALAGSARPDGAPLPEAAPSPRPVDRPGAVPPQGSVLPRPGRLIGRDDDLDQVTSLLTEGRLVTVSGPGGVGKTRLVAELAVVNRWAAAISVELAPVETGEVAAALGAQLGIRSDRATAATVAEHMHGAERLLVIDNAEHVLEEVTGLCRTLLDRCPDLRILVTSRARLDLPDERVHVLDPLTATGPDAPAVELFRERLAQSGRTRLVSSDDPVIREVCDRLDGLPLALELAAGRAAVLGVSGLRDRLDSVLDLVAAGAEGGRHASLRQVVAWSYDLLDGPSRRLLSALAAFEGEFDLDGAEQVGSAIVGQPVSLLLGRLVDASLVATSGVPGRYRLLELIRQFSRDQLAPNSIDGVTRAHNRWVSGRLHAIGRLIGPREGEMSDELDELRDEVRGALRRARATVSSELAAELLVPLAGFLLYRPDGELIAAGHDVMVDLRSRIGEDDLPANLVAAGARLAFLAGALADADDLVEICLGREPADQDAHRRALHARGVLDLYRGHHHRAVRSFSLVADDISASTVDRLDALGGLGLALCYDGQTTPARSVVERHRAAADAIGSGTYIAFADYMQGEIDLAAGQVDAAIPRLQDAADRAWDVGAGFVWGVAATVLAGALIRHRPPGEAVAHIPVLVERLHRTGTWTQLWTTLRLIAELLAAHGADETSVILLSAADLDPAAPRLSGEDLERYDALREQLRERLGVPTFDGLTTVVHGMERIDVLDRALASVRDLDTG